MNKVKKIIWKIEKKMIGLLNYLNTDAYKIVYNRYLQRIGINFTGSKGPNYVDPSAFFDGIDYSLISLGGSVVISKDVLFLTHDYSIFCALRSINEEQKGERTLLPISIGDNVFVGAKVIFLPGTDVEDNCIIGAGAVVKGHIPKNSVVVGNPAKIIKKTDELGKRWLEYKS